MVAKYYEIKDFVAGMDLRKTSASSPAGSLRMLRNAHITVGGEIEKRYSFTPHGFCPVDSRGLIELGNLPWTVRYSDVEFVFPGTGGNPIGVFGLPNPGGKTMNALIDWDIYDKDLYCIIQNTDGTFDHFYNRIKVPDTDDYGYYCRTYGNKIYTVQDNYLYFSATDAPHDKHGTGSGFINVAVNDADSAELTAIEVYYDKMALFSRRATQLWLLDPDPLKNQYVQTLRGTGTMAPQSVRQFVSNDLLYLAQDGIRSLRAKDASLTSAALVADIGSPLDPVMQELLLTHGEGWYNQAIGLLSVRSGRFWMIFPDQIYVLSQYASPRITAWSRYDPSFPTPIVAAVSCDPTMVFRDVNHTCWAYQDTSTPLVRDASPVEIILPFLDFDKPAQRKRFSGIDIGMEGDAPWTVSAAFDPNHEDVEDLLGVYSRSTYIAGRMPMVGDSTHVSLRFRSATVGPQKLSRVFVHYDDGETS